MSKKKTTVEDLIDHCDIFITAVCDECGDAVPYVRKDKIEKLLIKEGWTVLAGNVYCPECTKK